MLEPTFTFSGEIVRGKHLGTRLGFPTANIAYDPKSRCWPREGVYIGVAQLDQDARKYVCILNQGRHPTTPSGQPTVEAHMLGYPDIALYGRHITLWYHVFLRPETAFESLEALKQQLSTDRLSAMQWAQKNDPALLDGVDDALLPHQP